ncbi:MAG TPA: hypothetical protein VHH11_13800 [Gammaproteobacteria bacterium]|nr:hypothetical protein [Gammaproteobacteria bacterium]
MSADVSPNNARIRRVGPPVEATDAARLGDISTGPYSQATYATSQVLNDTAPNLVRFAGLSGAATATLPDLATTTWQIGRPLIVANADSTYLVEVLRAGADVIVPALRGLILYPGDVVALRYVAPNTWQVLARVQTTPANVDLYLDASGGNDNNTGTAARPLATVAEWQKRVEALPGWRGYNHGNLAAGTYALGTNAVLAAPASACGAEPACLIGTMADSGLGTRTYSAQSAGSGSTFGTLTDAVGGLTPSAYKGYTLRITGVGAQVGAEYQIVDNTATTFTVAGTFAVLTTETFVVEAPATILQSANQGIYFEGLGGTFLGLRHIKIDGQGIAGAALRVRGVNLYHSACQFTGWGTCTQDVQGQLNTMLAANAAGVANNANCYFPSLGLLRTVGSYFQSGLAGAQITNTRDGWADFQRCVIAGMIVTFSGGGVQATSCGFSGASGIRGQAGAQLLVATNQFLACAGIVGNYATAVLVLDDGSYGTLASNLCNNSTPGIVLSLSGNSVAQVSGLTGSGNAGVPVNIQRSASLIKSSGNTVTGAVAGNDVQVGGNAAPTAWATVNAGVVTDAAAATPQLCLAAA